MTVYIGSREIDILGAHLDATDGDPDAEQTVWFAYHTEAFEGDTPDHHRGIKRAHIGELQADDGIDEVFDALAALPDERVRGDHPWAKQARGESGGDD